MLVLSRRILPDRHSWINRISYLTLDKQAELTSLLTDFCDIFTHENIPMGHIFVVKHSIPTGAPLSINHYAEYLRL